MSLVLIGECSEAVVSHGVAKVLITVYSKRHPEYVLLNLSDQRGELEAGKVYRITIEEE
jgi:hypothetical protein